MQYLRTSASAAAGFLISKQYLLKISKHNYRSILWEKHKINFTRNIWSWRKLSVVLWLVLLSTWHSSVIWGENLQWGCLYQLACRRVSRHVPDRDWWGRILCTVPVSPLDWCSWVVQESQRHSLWRASQWAVFLHGFHLSSCLDFSSWWTTTMTCKPSIQVPFGPGDSHSHWM